LIASARSCHRGWADDCPIDEGHIPATPTELSEGDRRRNRQANEESTGHLDFIRHGVTA
jgi:hypothetical protein